MPDLSFYISPLSEEIREEGRVQGRAEGRAKNILLVLGVRGVDVTDATRGRSPPALTRSSCASGWFVPPMP
ncbi:hypothetical protein NKH18_12640 [Streptomyces sp. M10(2022)]